MCCGDKVGGSLGGTGTGGTKGSLGAKGGTEFSGREQTHQRGRGVEKGPFSDARPCSTRFTQQSQEVGITLPFFRQGHGSER